MIEPAPALAADERLVSRLAEGDETALARVLDRHWDAIVHYVVRLVGATDGAEDIAQEAFIRLWDRRRDWAPGSAARPLLFRIARNLALDHRRGEGVRARFAAAVRTEPAPVAAPPSAEADEIEAAVEAALARLNPRQREIVELSRLHGLSRAEIGAVTGLSAHTISNLLSTALARLARALAPHLEGELLPRRQPRPLRRA